MRALAPWSTVRGRLLMLAIGIEILMLFVMVFNSLRLLHGAMTKQALWQAEQMSPVLIAALTAPLAQQDFATVQAVIDESRRAGGVKYIVILDSAGRRVASSGWGRDQALPPPSVRFELFQGTQAPRYDVLVPIAQTGQPLGTLHFGLDLSQIVSARHLLLLQGGTIAIIEVLLSTVILTLLGYWLTRHLVTLTKASLEVANGNLTPAPVREGQDDVGRLGAAFNMMSRAISERVRELTVAKEALQERARELEDLNLTLESRVQEEVAKNREKDNYLTQQEKMASIGQLAAGVAHEINNPMGFVTSNLSTLGKYLQRLEEFIAAQDEAIRKGGDDAGSDALSQTRKQLKIDHILDDGKQLIAESLEGGGRVQHIVQSLKNFSRVDQVQYSRVDLNECLETTINIAWNEIKYVATLRREFGVLPPVCCYPQQLNQVFLNLLINASQAIESSGEIVVRTWSDGEDVFVSVSDTGKGIPQEIINRIFEPFFTTKDVGKGTGLGLSISYDIIRKHSGEIAVESTPGAGTIFKVRLPVSQEACVA
ncbi:HAMP domain-containing protein [Geomonas sp. Red69]|uniref:sensor histidine kinase n=1 Tax=Geomonas diazotrophica TaxID=2843197 RepID=UPI001C11F8B3|nr:ATP-binding protein [Geomonas diazotrophica]MBU5636226.1 HAMP domain-containing protein [Geomonas diazotrophica]